jgi:membrane protein DedA with SNARE-associated domain
MTIPELIHTYGYIGVLIGTFLEGETTLLLAAFAAQQGYMELPYVMAAASIGSFCGDQSFFWLGRKRRSKTLARHPSLAGKIEKAQSLMERYRRLVMFFFRFMYGLRTVIPFAIGMSKISAAEFITFSTMSSVVWAVLVAGAGYLFGNALESLLGDVKRYELIVLGAIAATGAVVWIIWLYRRKPKSNHSLSE